MQRSPDISQLPPAHIFSPMKHANFKTLKQARWLSPCTRLYIENAGPSSQSKINSSPDPNAIEEDILYDFLPSRHAVVHGTDTRPIKVHEASSLEGVMYMRRMHKWFADLSETEIKKGRQGNVSQLGDITLSTSLYYGICREGITLHSVKCWVVV